MDSNISRAMYLGPAWMVAMRWSIRLIGLVSLLVLARLLEPEDFGIVAMSLIVVNFLELFSEAGLDLALIRKADADRDFYDTAWTAQILLGFIVATLIVLSAPIAVAAFDEPRLALVIPILALRSIIGSFENIGVVAFRKELRFQTDFRFGVLKKLASFIIVVSLAFLLRNHWALILGVIASSALGVLISYRMHPYRPRICFSRLDQLWAFSFWVLAWRLGEFLNRTVDQFLIGSSFGTIALGKYFMATEVSTTPTSELAVPLGRGLFPSYAKLLEQPQAFMAAVRLTFEAVSYVALPLGAGAFAVAPDLVLVILGEKWIEIVPYFRWLALFGALSAMSLTLTPSLQVSGHERLATIDTWVGTTAACAAVLLGRLTGSLTIIAALRAGAALLTLPLKLVFVSTASGLPVTSMICSIWRPLAAAIVMLLVVGGFPLTDLAWPPLRLFARVGLGMLIFVAASGSLWVLAGRPRSVESQALRLAHRSLQRPAERF